MCIKTDLDVRRVSSGEAGAITVGYTAIAGQSALPLMLRRAAESMPGVSFVLRELVSTDQMDGLVKGSVDIGLLRPIVGRPGVVSRPLMKDRLVVALPEGSSLLGNMAAPAGEPLPLGSLDRLPLLMYSTKEARYFHDLVLRLFASAGAHANVTQYASQVPALLAFVQAGLGVTLVPASAMAFAPAGVEFHEIDGRHGIQELNRVDLELAWNEETANPAVLRLLDLIESPDPGTQPEKLRGGVGGFGYWREARSRRRELARWLRIAAAAEASSRSAMAARMERCSCTTWSKLSRA